MMFEDWEEITRCRYELWSQSHASKKALELDYDEFEEDAAEAVRRVMNHLERDFSNQEIKRLADLFQPRNTSQKT